MSADATYSLIIRQDPHAAGRYLASCPDIPGWYATGPSAAEASKMAAEIVRGIVAERRTNGVEVPAVHVQTTQVVIGAGGGSRSAAPRPIPQGDTEEPTSISTSASAGAHSREQRPTEEDEGSDERVTFLSSESSPERVPQNGQ